MDQELDNKFELKDKLISFYQKNKLSILTSVCLLIILIISFFFIQNLRLKNNELIGEKYIQAGLYLASDKKEESKKLFEEIILSENKFYSILSLNTILEKNLESDKNKILKYFEIVEDLANTKEQKDLLIFKKSLFLINVLEIKEGEKLLRMLINSDSKYKKLAEEILLD
tara:strand:+ start:67 stop:576 length:510 start_codon:yes stop_codon:yes gene_type:complete